MPEQKLLDDIAKLLSRLENLDKARLMGIDKALIGVRKKNLATAGAGYIELQEIALADPEPEPETENNYDGPG